MKKVTREMKIYPENTTSRFSEMFGFKLERGFDFGDLIWFLEYNLGYEVGSDDIPLEIWDILKTVAKETDNFKFDGGYYKYLIIN